MIANFKNDNKIIVTGADRAEALLIKNLVANAESGVLKLSEFYDIDGDVNGFALELTEAPVPDEPTNDNENVEGGED